MSGTLETSQRGPAVAALTVSTVAFAICFAAWVVNAVLVTWLVATGVYSFSESQVGWLLAAPMLSGALCRVPLGIFTDKFGGRIVFTVLLVVISIPMFLVSFADSYAHFLWASLGFGLAGGGFAVGVGYVSVWFNKERQGTALGIFGVGNAGAALTTIFAPPILVWLTDGGTNAEGWRNLPRIYAAMLLAMGIVFFIVTRHRVAATGQAKTLRQRLAPLRDIIVWRLGLYYFLFFGAFITLAQWLIPYSINVYGLTVAEAGLLAAVFSLPSGVVRAAGGWLSDRFGARTVMYGVFFSCILSCIWLSIPKMDIESPGEGLSAKSAGTVTAVSPREIIVGDRRYEVTPPPASTPGEIDNGEMFLPSVTSLQTPVVSQGDLVAKKELLARGTTNIYYPANLWLFAGLVFVFGLATGIGKAGVYRLIPDQFPNAVGTVGGMVGLLGALGGFVFPPIFGYLLQWTGLWSSCWIVLSAISIGCLTWMHVVARRIMKEEAPDLVQLMERQVSHRVRHEVVMPSQPGPVTVEELLRRIPVFSDLTDGQVKELVAIGHRQEVAGGEMVFHEGDPGDTLFLILDGSARVLGHNEGGEPMVLAVLHAGTYFGELSIIDGEPRSAGVATITPCDFFVIERGPFLSLLTKVPRMLADLLVGFSAKIRDSNERLFDLVLRKEHLLAQQEIDRHRSIGEMVAGVAHELNTPLDIVNHAASIITENLDGDSVQALAEGEGARATLHDISEASTLILDNIRRANKLIRSFKNLSVSQIGDSRETVDLLELTREVTDLFRLKARSSGLEIEVCNELPEGLGAWEGYPGNYSQILLNLLTNVDRYAYPDGEGGRVEIELSSAPASNGVARHRVVVRDFGRGIPVEQQAQVFDAFYTTGRSSGGTGLGLAIVQNLVTGSLQGEIDLRSPPGGGTEIELRFPRVIDEPGPGKNGGEK